MGTYIAMPGQGAEITAAYRKIEVAYHELQAAQIHLRSVHARSMHARPKGQDLLRQDLTRISDRVERATSAYREAMEEYVRAGTSGDGQVDAAPPRPPASSARLQAGIRP